MGIVSKARSIYAERGVVLLVKRSLLFLSVGLLRKTYRFGDRRECPVCGFTGRKFRAAGLRGRPESRCPRCGAAERTRLLWRYLQLETTVLDRGGRLLYFAPIGTVDAYLRRDRRVLSTDLRRGDVDMRADITGLPFRDGAFDTVICSHVLSYVPDDGAAFAEIHRVLKRGGDALLLLSTAGGDGEPLDRRDVPTGEYGAHKLRRYDERIHARLSDVGFDVSAPTYAAGLTDAEVERYGLLVRSRTGDDVEYEEIIHCRK